MTGGGAEIERLIELMAKLPGLGPRSARRAALALVKKRERLLVPLAQAMAEVANAPFHRIEYLAGVWHKGVPQYGLSHVGAHRVLLQVFLGVEVVGDEVRQRCELTCMTKGRGELNVDQWCGGYWF